MTRVMLRRSALALSVVALVSLASACERLTGARGAGATPSARADAGADAGRAGEPVRFRTADGWTIAATYYAGNAPSAVVLVHQLGANRNEWDGLVEVLQRETVRPGVLAIDLRGHGASTSAPGGGTLSWPAFENDPVRWSAARADVNAAVNYLLTRRRDAAIVLVGSSLGATLVLRHAAEEPLVRGLVLLSPGLAYRGVDALTAATAYFAASRPAMLVAGQGDTPSVEAIARFTAQASPAAEANLTRVLFADTSAHGTALTAPGLHPEFWSRVASWVRERTASSP